MIGYKVFGYCTSNDRGLCGKGLCVPFVLLGGGCARLGMRIDAGVVNMAAQKEPYDGVF